MAETPVAGAVGRIDAALGAFVTAGRADALPGSVHLHCTDADGEWMIERGPAGAAELSRRHAKGDCAIRGTADALADLASGSGSLDGLEVLGDRAVADGFVAALRMD